MGTTAEKIEYLNETKELIKQSLNDLGADIEDSNSFRSYVQKINTLYEDWPKITEEGTFLSLNSTQKGKMKIELKGNTLQDGEPTPTNPVEVQVVKGKGKVKVENINILNPYEMFENQINSGLIQIQSNGKIILNGTVNYSNRELKKTKLKAGTYHGIEEQRIVHFFWDDYDDYLKKDTYTLVEDKEIAGYLADGTYNNVELQPMIYTGNYDANKSYISHKEQVLPLNLPVENLLDKNNANVKNGYIVSNLATIGDNGPTNKIVYIEIKPNTTYTVSKNNFRLDAFGIASTVNTPAKDVPITQKAVNKSVNSLTITTGANDNYLSVYCKGQNLIFPEIFNNIDLQIEEGEKANTYTPYGTPSIELCKIGDYQDYFYKDNGKWYLHKEIGKIYFENYTCSKSGMFATYFDIPNIKYVSANTEIGSALAEKYKVRQGSGLSNYPNYLAVDVNRVNVYVGVDVDNASGLFYYALNTSTNTEITDTTLISQLEAIYNAMSYKEQTNISQENSNLPFILNVSALQKE